MYDLDDYDLDLAQMCQYPDILLSSDRPVKPSWQFVFHWGSWSIYEQ